MYYTFALTQVIGGLCTVQRKTFEGGNFHKFRGFRATHESFLHEIWACRIHLRMIGFTIQRKFSLRNGHFLPIHESFLPRKFPAIRYVCIANISLMQAILLFCNSTGFERCLLLIRCVYCTCGEPGVCLYIDIILLCNESALPTCH